MAAKAIKVEVPLPLDKQADEQFRLDESRKLWDDAVYDQMVGAIRGNIPLPTNKVLQEPEEVDKGYAASIATSSREELKQLLVKPTAETRDRIPRWDSTGLTWYPVAFLQTGRSAANPMYWVMHQVRLAGSLL